MSKENLSNISDKGDNDNFDEKINKMVQIEFENLDLS